MEECLQAILQGIDIRTQEQIVQKALMVHKSLYAEKKDYSFMCMELLLAVMMSVYDYKGYRFERPISVSDFNNIFAYMNTITKKKIKPHFTAFFKEKFEEIHFRKIITISDVPDNYELPVEPDLYAAILYTWCWMHKKSKVPIKAKEGGIYERISNNYTELKNFIDFIDLIG